MDNEKNKPVKSKLEILTSFWLFCNWKENNTDEVLLFLKDLLQCELDSFDKLNLDKNGMPDIDMVFNKMDCKTELEFLTTFNLKSHD